MAAAVVMRVPKDGCRGALSVCVLALLCRLWEERLFRSVAGFNHLVDTVLTTFVVQAGLDPQSSTAHVAGPQVRAAVPVYLLSIRK